MKQFTTTQEGQLCRKCAFEQIIRILKENEGGVKVKELCRKYGISDAIYNKWKAKFSVMEVNEARRVQDECLNESLFSTLAEAQRITNK